mmetsp:Transcript_58358/g.126198  ORF Transcript_58358/g.126198 Transcript_58358/m.126198 type:complete len:280 (-) Transcript_58358:9-848(-)
MTVSAACATLPWMLLSTETLRARSSASRRCSQMWAGASSACAAGSLTTSARWLWLRLTEPASFSRPQRSSWAGSWSRARYSAAPARQRRASSPRPCETWPTTLWRPTDTKCSALVTCASARRRAQTASFRTIPRAASKSGRLWAPFGHAASSSRSSLNAKLCRGMTSWPQKQAVAIARSTLEGLRSCRPLLSIFNCHQKFKLSRLLHTRTMHFTGCIVFFGTLSSPTHDGRVISPHQFSLQALRPRDAATEMQPQQGTCCACECSGAPTFPMSRPTVLR